MDTIYQISLQASTFLTFGIIAMVFVKYSFKRAAMLRTVMFIDHSPRLSELPIGSGVPSIILLGVLVLCSQAWIAIPVMVLGVALFNVRQEMRRYDLRAAS